ncbi:MAG: hypothetical protein ABIO70_25590 [Pseudomonadota bacterium]
MRRLLPLLLLLAAPAAHAQKIRFQRVDLISEAPGWWLNYDLPMADVNLQTTAIRWVEQLNVVLDMPLEGLSTGISIGAQTLWYERPLLADGDLSWGLGVQTRLLLPSGLNADLSWRWRRLRVGAGVSLASSATWARPDWTAWDAVPTLGIGVGRRLIKPVPMPTVP